MPARLDAVHPVLMCREVTVSVRFYERLGFARAFLDDPAQPRYEAVRREGVELHLQWHDATQWEQAGDRPTYRFVVSDVDGLFQEWRDARVLPEGTVVRDTPWGTREFHVRDPDGNGLQFYRGSK